MKIQRYDQSNTAHGYGIMENDDEGCYVDYDDHEAKMSQALRIIRKLRKENYESRALKRFFKREFKRNESRIINLENALELLHPNHNLLDE